MIAIFARNRHAPQAGQTVEDDSAQPVLHNEDIPHFGDGNLSDAKLTAALRATELLVKGRLDGILAGSYVGFIPGLGSEPGEHKLYQVGDDVRHIDWNVTARTTQTYVRQTTADRELEVWMVIDLSPSMHFGTTACTKRDMAILGAALVIQLALRGGNKIGAIINNGERIERVSAKTGRAHASGLLKKIATIPPAKSPIKYQLNDALLTVNTVIHRRGLIAVISDFLGKATWQRTLKNLSSMHTMLAIEVVDPRDISLPPLGRVNLLDPASHTVKNVFITPEVSANYNRAATAQLLANQKTFRQARATVLHFVTDQPWFKEVFSFVQKYKKVQQR